MLAKTHLAFGFLFGLVLLPFVPGNKYIYFAIVLAASLLPDIDSPRSKASRKLGLIGSVTRTFTKHRGIFHSLWIPLVFGAVLWYFVGHFYAVALVVGYGSHLLIDGFTKAGINFLHPFSTLRLQGFVQTGSFLETCLFFVFVGVSIAKLLPFI
ncbi:metal-dependent hydrolase [Candidatus Woesearchaeota archaeon]|nr:metal-dependent hydrolase [Candidatus Woesearchaeota archaeon]MBW3022031.1 metal-dependent hydrolase [Candidatus Woesearchaeota archaeon]